MPPKELICLAATSCPGWVDNPGYNTVSTAGCSSRNSATSAAFSLCRCIRSTNVLSPRMVRYASNGPGTAPAPFCRNANAVSSSSSLVSSAPPTTSECPPMYLVVECSTTSAPKSNGCCNAGEAKVLSTNTFMLDTFMLDVAASCAIAPMSAMESKGLVGVSTQI